MSETEDMALFDKQKWMAWLVEKAQASGHALLYGFNYYCLDEPSGGGFDAKPPETGPEII